ncbi:MAG: serpin family protein [Lachnospiraceae bacterium]|nr:serpin family protein [Lachnospiraceae bacterium]
MKKLSRYICLLLAGLMIIPLAACEQKTPENQGSEELGKYEIVSVKYPEMAHYPNESEFINSNGEFDDEGFEKVYEAWRRDKEKQNAGYVNGYQGELNDFISALINELMKDNGGENVTCSPINIYMALAMLAETTEGETRAQILNLLGAGSVEEVREQAKNIWNAAYIDDGASTSVLANSLWLRDDLEYKPEVFNTLANNYYASSFKGKMGSEEFNQALRDWINEQTGGLLKEQASGLELDPATVLALASTIYFREKWDAQFSPNANDERVFHGAKGDETVTFMNQSDTQTYCWADKFAVVAKEFTNNGSMLFFLPDEGVAPEELLTDEQFLGFVSGSRRIYDWADCKYLIVNMSVPKFDVSSDIDLANGLKHLGIVDAFDSGKADFSPISEVENVYLDTAKHAARVKIDEEGCEAAAYTVMAMCGAAMPPQEEVDFVLDRPFIFVIKDSSNLPLFVGIVNTLN